jgi:hypothetical protein
MKDSEIRKHYEEAFLDAIFEDCDYDFEQAHEDTYVSFMIPQENMHSFVEWVWFMARPFPFPPCIRLGTTSKAGHCLVIVTAEKV